MQDREIKVITTYDMAKDTLKMVRQIRFGFIALTISVLIAIGSICVLMIFWHMGHTYAMVLHSCPKKTDEVISSKLSREIIWSQWGHLAAILFLHFVLFLHLTQKAQREPVSLAIRCSDWLHGLYFSGLNSIL